MCLVKAIKHTIMCVVGFNVNLYAYNVGKCVTYTKHISNLISILALELYLNWP